MNISLKEATTAWNVGINDEVGTEADRQTETIHFHHNREKDIHP